MEYVYTLYHSNTFLSFLSIIGTCLDYVYLLVFTSGENDSESSHPHNIEVVAENQTRLIALPDREGDYETHRGDIWKLHIYDDLGFDAGSCVRCVRYPCVVHYTIPVL